MIKTRRLANFIVMMLLLPGCEKQYLADDGYIPEVVEINAQENRKVHFFKSSADFDLQHTTIADIEKLLKTVRSEGLDNIGFMLISNGPILMENQKRAKKQIRQLMYKHGFINSRIVDLGICVHKKARVGIRIDVLRYDVQEVDCNPWSEYVGDIDTNKHLPKHGTAIAYNTIEMIANKADFVAPRKYKGSDAKSAIAAIGASSGSGSAGTSSSGAK
ncbi:MAG: CpaD family pilus assembly lipoprotein [Holosporaceae bacterium]|jgi:type IV pilus biogenesis protein CpaD/CtpE|nr:CpaD family pilus assembly lipoprotein [Holosporaceae bacterium]